jgi:hypothetical protein
MSVKYDTLKLRSTTTTTNKGQNEMTVTVTANFGTHTSETVCETVEQSSEVVEKFLEMKPITVSVRVND